VRLGVLTVMVGGFIADQQGISWLCDASSKENKSGR